MLKSKTYIEYILMLKDDEINENLVAMNNLFIKYKNNEISKEYLLDKHTERNKLFKDWMNIYNYLNN